MSKTNAVGAEDIKQAVKKRGKEILSKSKKNKKKVAKKKSKTGPKKKTTKNRKPDGTYKFDPRQQLCWDYYINPNSKTFGNAYQSALLAGFSKSYSTDITLQVFFKENVGREELFIDAERVLREMVNLPTNVLEYSHTQSRKLEEGEEPDDDDTYGKVETFLVTNPQLVRIKQDTAKFLAERLGKSKGYSTRQEVTGAHGESLVADPETQALSRNALREYMKK